MFEKIKKYWQIILGFSIAFISALILTSSKNEKTKSKLNKLDRKDNDKLDEIHDDRNTKIEEVIEKHHEALNKIQEYDKIEKDIIEEKVEKKEKELNKLTNDELAKRLNKR